MRGRLGRHKSTSFVSSLKFNLGKRNIFWTEWTTPLWNGMWIICLEEDFLWDYSFLFCIILLQSAYLQQISFVDNLYLISSLTLLWNQRFREERKAYFNANHFLWVSEKPINLQALCHKNYSLLLGLYWKMIYEYHLLWLMYRLFMTCLEFNPVKAIRNISCSFN